MRRRQAVAELVDAASGGDPSAGDGRIPSEPPDTVAVVENPHETQEVSARMQVHLVDVGQGAATLLEFPCGAVLIDTGGETSNGFDSTEHLMRYLATFFARRIDLHDTLDLLLLMAA